MLWKSLVRFLHYKNCVLLQPLLKLLQLYVTNSTHNRNNSNLIVLVLIPCNYILIIMKGSLYAWTLVSCFPKQI